MKRIFKLMILILFLININVYAANETAITNVKVNDESIRCDNLKCNATVDSDKVTIKYTLIDPEATSSGFNSGDTFDLSDTQLVKKLVVTKKMEGLETPLSSEYVFTIIKHHESEDASLKKLVFNGKKIELKKDVYSYNVNVNYKQKDIKLEAEVSNEYAKLEMPLDTEFSLDESTKSFIIKVTSESGIEKEYIIFVTRETRPDTSIKEIKLSSGSITLEKGLYEYKLNVPYDVNKLDFDITLNSDKAKYDINKPESLVVGENTVEILVKNADLEQKYVIVVNRLDNTQDAIVNLEDLKIEDYDELEFVVSNTNYELYFDEVPTSLRIEATPVNKDNDVKITGNYNLKDGSSISIKVINENLGLSKEYTLNIHKNKISKANKSLIFIIVGSILLVTGIIVSILLLRKKSKKKKINKRINIVKKNIEQKEKEKESKNTEKKEIKQEVKQEIIDDDIEII